MADVVDTRAAATTKVVDITRVAVADTIKEATAVAIDTEVVVGPSIPVFCADNFSVRLRDV